MLLFQMMSIEVDLFVTIFPKLPFSPTLFLIIILLIFPILAKASPGAMANLTFPNCELGWINTLPILVGSPISKKFQIGTSLVQILIILLSYLLFFLFLILLIKEFFVSKISGLTTLVVMTMLLKLTTLCPWLPHAFFFSFYFPN